MTSINSREFPNATRFLAASEAEKHRMPRNWAFWKEHDPYALFQSADSRACFSASAHRSPIGMR
jgi:hypothetical protein